jgi:hypothetical protein
MVVRDHRRRGEVAPADSTTKCRVPAEFYCFLEKGVPERVALAAFRLVFYSNRAPCEC